MLDKCKGDTKTNSKKTEVIFNKLAQPFLQRHFSVTDFDYLLPFWLILVARNVHFFVGHFDNN